MLRRPAREQPPQRYPSNVGEMSVETRNCTNKARLSSLAFFFLAPFQRKTAISARLHAEKYVKAERDLVLFPGESARSDAGSL